MEAKNNFKELMEEEDRYAVPPPGVEKKVESELAFLSFFGKIIELFVPKILELFVIMAGGTVTRLQDESKPVALPEEKGEPAEDDFLTPGDAE